MDKIQKFEYVQTIEAFLEENQIYELFQGLLKQLIIHRPENPLDFLIERLARPDSKRIFIVGPPGSNRKEIALSLAEHFNWVCISVGDLLNKEVSKKSEYGKFIAEARKKYEYSKSCVAILS